MFLVKLGAATIPDTLAAQVVCAMGPFVLGG